MSTNKLHVELAAGQSLSIGGAIVTLERKSGQRARLTVLAPPGISIKHPKTHTSAQECASSPQRGSKEQAHVRAAASM